MRKKVLPILVVILAISIFAFGFVAGVTLEKGARPSIAEFRNIINSELGKPNDLDFGLFWDTWNLLEAKYADTTRLDRKKMFYGAISGLVSSLEDPYTTFLSPEDTERFEEDISGKFQGIGIEIGIRKDILIVIAPIKGTPADRAGLRAGDKILLIDGTPTNDLTLDEAVSRIRGLKGTKVSLQIFRNSEEEARTIEIIRDVIEIPSLSWEIKEGNIAYIQIFNFNYHAEGDFQKAVAEILASNTDRIILDLRNNPGGLLESSIDIAGYFLPVKSLVVSEEARDGKREHRSNGTGNLIKFPVVILINQGSASASEILAGALHDNRGVLLIGEKTFGKGSVQALEELRDGSTVKLTISRWFTPSGGSINELGLEPDTKIELTEEDFEAERDPQLEKAIETIKTL